MLFPKPVGNTAIESFLSNTFCIISFCSDLSCRWNCLSCRIRLNISSFHFHFGIYKRDLAILIEWGQQRIAWWELLNAKCQIICIYYVNNIQITWKTIYLSVFCRTNSALTPHGSSKSNKKQSDSRGISD
jgi:hypothetical protein